MESSQPHPVLLVLYSDGAAQVRHSMNDTLRPKQIPARFEVRRAALQGLLAGEKQSKPTWLAYEDPVAGERTIDGHVCSRGGQLQKNRLKPPRC